MTYRILVVRLGSLGDVVLTSAAVLNLKLAHPDSHLVFLTKERFAPLARLLTGVDEVVALQGESSTRQFVETLRQLDRRNFDLVVDLHGNFRSYLMRKLVAAGNTVSYPKRRLSRWLTTKHLQVVDDPPHTIDLYNSALERAGIRTYAKRPIIHHQNLSALPAELSRLPNPVVIAPGAAHATKQWPIGKFLEVARGLIERHHAHILWTAVAADRLSDVARQSLGADCTELIDLPIEQLAPVLAHAEVVISNDSGLMHLASAVGTPVLAIFGPTHPSLGFSPRGLHDSVIQVDEYCRPCSLHGKTPCYRTEQFCFTRIAPEMVLAAACQLLSKPLQKAILFDRDGTLITDKHYLSDPNQVELLPGAIEVLQAARKAGYRLAVLSNQSGVARGFFSIDSVEAVNRRFEQHLAKAGVKLDGMYFCPHYPGGSASKFAVSCECRKPHPGMAEQAALELRLNLHKSMVVGDKLDDLNLGLVAGSRSLLVLTGHGRQTEQSIRSSALYGRVKVLDSVRDILL
jgi:D,D-heptose 1,7-bisphosphate phosphatase